MMIVCKSFTGTIMCAGMAAAQGGNPDLLGPYLLVAPFERNEHLQIELAGIGQTHILRIFSEAKPASVICDGLPLTENKDWCYSAAKTRLFVRSGMTGAASYAIRW